MMGTAAGGDNSAAVEVVKGPLAPDQPAPRSDQAPPDGSAAAGAEIIGTGGDPAGAAAPSPATPSTSNPFPAAPASDANELKPNVAADPNELKPNVENAPAPTQVNEIQTGQATNGAATADSGASATADDKDIDAAMSSSKRKKKKGLGKIVPF
jgi:hypothetical protein